MPSQHYCQLLGTKSWSAGDDQDVASAGHMLSHGCVGVSSETFKVLKKRNLKGRAGQRALLSSE